MTVAPDIVGGVLLGAGGSDREVPMSIGETLLALTLAEVGNEVVRIRTALEAIIADPGNPFSAAETARQALATEE